MFERVKQFILSNHLLSGKYNTILVAVSGGIDSCVLLDIFSRLERELKFTLVVIHFNHRIRGNASQADEKFVKTLAQKYGYRIITGRIGKVPVRRNETSLREHRFKFYHGLLQENPRALLATGHTFSDQVETFIMRLANGSRLRGLLGIKPRAGRLIHPLLQESRDDIEHYAKQRKLSFREDQTNYDTEILRNRIRHRIVPYLKKNLSPDIEQAIAKSMADLTGQYQIYEQALKQVISRHTKKENGAVLLHRWHYLQCATTLRRGLLEYCISEVYHLNYVVSDQSLQQWDKFIRTAQCGKRKSFHQREIALAERVYIHFGKPGREYRHHLKLHLGNRVVLDNKESIHFSRISGPQVNFTANRNVEFVDGAVSGDTLQVRFWKRGDRFRPLGMKQDKKLSDFFIDLKLSRDVKQRIPLVCRNDEIIWIGGYRLDDRYKVTKTTKKYYKLELKIK
jgi:tRNA(Ile)-lysidine synthase